MVYIRISEPISMKMRRGGGPSIKNTLSTVAGERNGFTGSNGLNAVLAMKNGLQLNHDTVSPRSLVIVNSTHCMK